MMEMEPSERKPEEEKPRKRKKTTKKRKDRKKDEPRRALTAFFWYMKLRRETLAKEMFGMPNSQLNTVCSSHAILLH